VDKINIPGEALDVTSFEIKRIVGNQDSGIGPAFDLDTAANVVEKAVAGADVIMRFVGIEVLIVVVELNATGGDSFKGLAVVFDVIGAETRVAEVNVHIAISQGDIAARHVF
jgi:hypothetical protein